MPDTEHICQLLRDIMRTFNNLNIDSGTLIDRIKKTMQMYAEEGDIEKYRLVQQDKENKAWEDQRDAMFKASKQQNNL